MEPVKFAVKITDQASEQLEKIVKLAEGLKDIKLNVDVSALNQFKEALATINNEGVKGAIDSVNKLNKSLAEAGNKYKDYADVSAFKDAVAQIEKLEAAIRKIDYSKVGDKTGMLNANSEEIKNLQKMAQEFQGMMTRASAELFRMDPSAVDKFKHDVQGIFDNIDKTLASHNGAVTDKFGFVKAIQEAKIQMDTLFKPEAFQNFGSGIASSITNITALLNAALDTCQRKVADLRQSLGESGFTELKNKADAAVEPLTRLAEAFGKLTVSMGTNQELKNFMVGLGEVINNIRTLTGTSEGAKALGTEQMAKNIEMNTQRIEAAMFKIREAKADLEASTTLGKNAGLDDSDMRMRKIGMYTSYLTDLQRKLRELREDKVALAQSGATQDILGPVFQTSLHVVSNMTNEMKQYHAQYEKYTKKIASDTASIEALKKQLDDLKNLNTKSDGSPLVDGLERKINTVMVKLAYLKHQMQNLDAKSASKLLDKGWDDGYQKLIRDNTILIENTKRYNTMLQETETLMNRLSTINTTAQSIDGVDKSKGEGAAARLEAFMQKLQGINNEELKNETVVAELVNEYNQLTRACNSAANAQERLNNAQLKKNKTSADKDIAEKAESMNKASIEINKLNNQIKDFEALVKRATTLNGKGFTIDTSELQAHINKLKNLKSELVYLESGRATSTGVTRTSNYTGSADYVNERENAKRVAAAMSKQVAEAERADARATKENAKAKTEASSATHKLTLDEQALTRAIQAGTNSAQNQSRILSELKGMATQYISAYALMGFGKEMAQITGELELQKKSLSVILDNASTASMMYGQIRDLSQMSPFTFMDLMKSTRQLAAFGIETKDLYGTMKSLSDIGAGLNVDVNRLILAYGHTRSYGYLSGIQNRQFENAGIDMIGGLVKKYNELADAEKAAGREAEYVSRKDIFKRMRNKEISFSDVEDVIMDLDRPGGKFYNMQEKQFETLGGKLRNLANNYNIMMSELGEKNRGVLMFAVNALTEVHENWRRYERIIYGVVTALGAMKAAQLAVGASASAMNKQIAANARVNNANIYSNAFLTSMGRGHGWQHSGASGRTAVKYGKSNAPTDAFVRQQIVQNEQLSNLTKQRIALTGKLTQAQRAEILMSTGLKKADAERVASLGGVRRALMGMEIGLKQVGLAMKSFAISMLPMAAITAAVAIFMKFKEAAEQAANVAKSLREDSGTDIQGIRQSLEEYNSAIHVLHSKSFKSSQGSARLETFNVDREMIEAKGVEEVFKDLTTKLQNQSPLYDGDYFDVMSAGDQYAQILELFDKFKKLDFVKQVEQNTADAMGKALETTGAHWYEFYNLYKDGEGLVENMKDFAEANQKIFQSLEISESQYQSLEQKDKDAIEKLMRELGVTRETAMAKYLYTGQAGSLVGQIVGSRKSLRDMQLDAVSDDMKAPAEKMAAVFKSYFDGDVEGQTMYFEDFMNKMFTEAKVGDDESRNSLRLKFLEVLRDAMPEAEGAKLMEQVMSRSIGAQVIANVNKNVNQNTKEGDLDGIVRASVKSAISMLRKMNPEYAKEYKKVAEKNMQAYFTAAREQAARLMLMEDWQKRAKSMSMTLDIDMDTDYTEFIEKQRKELKEKLEKFNSNRERIKWIVGADLTLDLNMKSLQNAIKQLTIARNKIANANAGLYRRGNGAVKGADYVLLQQNRGQMETIDMMLENLKSMERIGKYMDAEHQKWDKDKAKKTGKGTNKDKQADDWLELLRLIKEAYSWYKKWEKEVGKKAAIKMVEVHFKNVLPEDVLKDIDNGYKPYVEKIQKMAQDRIDKYGEKELKGYVHDRNINVVKTASGLLEDFDYQKFQSDSQDITSKMGDTMDRIIEKYDNFRSVLESTGSTDIASAILGEDYQWQSKAEVIRKWIESVLRSISALDKINLDEAINGIPMRMADKETITDYVKNALAEVDSNGNLTEESANMIDAVSNALIKWTELEKEFVKSSIANYAGMTKDLADNVSQISRIQGELKNNLDMANALKDPKARWQAASYYRAKSGVSLMELSLAYRRLMNNPLTTSKEDGRNAVAMARAQYDNLFANGGISAEDYTKKIEELNKALRAIDNAAVDEWVLFLEGGMKSVRSQRINKDNELIANANAELDKAYGDMREAWQKGDMKAFLEAGKRVKEAQVKREKAEKDKSKEEGKQDSEEKFTRTMNAIIKGLQDFQQAISLVSDALESFGLGDSEIGNSLKDASTLAGGALQGAQALSFAGPWGMAAGAALGLASGVMKVHDENLQRNIDKLNEDVSRIESYTETISKAGERTLGYNDGSMMRQYLAFWGRRERENNRTRMNVYGVAGSVSDKASLAMIKYYNEALRGSTGYEQQYNMLIKKRQDYIDMYNLEASKKNQSKEQLEEYKSQIAALDDEIAHFAEDLAKDLWGIDLKSWADELSDALSTAWENGTSMVEAYGNTARSIIQGIAKEMLSLGIIQPMMEGLRKDLFGYTDNKGSKVKGIFDENNPEESMGNVIEYVSKFFGDGGKGQATVNAATHFWEGIEQILNRYGMTAKEKGSSTLSSGIQGMSEETANLLAGYVNALRQDVSILRILQTNFVTQYWQEYITMCTNTYKSIGNIEKDVALMRQVQATMSGHLEAINSRFARLTNGTERLHIK